MVKNITYLLICSTVVGVVFFTSCKEKINVPPTFDLTGEWLPDTIYKNGYRIYYLDSIIEDKDDNDSTIVWSVSSGPLLTIRLIDSTAGNFVKIEPMRNQTGNDWVDFTATDPMGARASKTCQVYVIEPDFIFNINDTQIGRNDTIIYIKNNRIEYHLVNKNLLQWTVNTDTRFLRCDTTTNQSNIYLFAEDTVITTGALFEIYDPENHVYFNRSILVDIH